MPAVRHTPPARVRAAATAALVALALALAGVGGCGTTRLAAAPATPTDLSGHWVLDAAASDDARRIIAAALPKPRRERVARPAVPGGPGAGPGPDSGDERPGGAAGGRAAAYRERGGGAALAFLREYVAPAEYLELQPEGAGSLTIVQGERRRTHELGTEFPPSVTDRYGSRVVRAGWDGRALVVTSDAGQQFRLRETFRAGPEPGTLAYRVELDAPGIDDVDIDALYRRTSAGPPSRVPRDGPPAPLR